jgi:hypothetical protein
LDSRRESRVKATTDGKSIAFIAVTLYRQIGFHRLFEGMTGRYVATKRQ